MKWRWNNLRFTIGAICSERELFRNTCRMTCQDNEIEIEPESCSNSGHKCCHNIGDCFSELFLLLNQSMPKNIIKVENGRLKVVTGIWKMSLCTGVTKCRYFTAIDLGIFIYSFTSVTHRNYDPVYTSKDPIFQ